MSSSIEIKKKCEWCGNDFIDRKTTTAYCSHRRLPKEKAPITEFYTTAEVKEKYNVVDSWIFVFAKKHNPEFNNEVQHMSPQGEKEA